ncbi:thymidylate kinase [Halorubrum sp. AJ67]|nr:thymidylate kinase [Halorubrum sp. AJ67]
MTGRFISIEGVDGAGTTTQAQAVADELVERHDGLTEDDTLVTAEPTDGEIGRLIRTGLAGDIELSQQALALLFAADRVNHIKTTIEPALNDGKTVITDRYYLSSYAYQ